MHRSINHTGWKEYNKKFRRPLNYMTYKNPSNYKNLWLLLPLVLLFPATICTYTVGNISEKRAKRWLWKQKPGLRSMFSLFTAIFTFTLLNLEALHKESTIKSITKKKKKKSLKVQELLCYCYNNFKEAVWNTDCVNKSG